jgi:hypothetical protein
MSKRLACIHGYFSKRHFDFIDDDSGIPAACADGFAAFFPKALHRAHLESEWTPVALRGKRAVVVVGETEAQLKRLIPGAFIRKALAAQGFGPMGMHLFSAGFKQGEPVAWTLATERTWNERYALAAASGVAVYFIPRYIPWDLAKAPVFSRRY